MAPCLTPNLSPTSSVTDLLSSLLNTDTSTETLGSLPITVDSVTTTLGALLPSRLPHGSDLAPVVDGTEVAAS